MNTIVKAELSQAEKIELLSLWNKEYPVQLSYKDTGAFDEFLQKMGSPKHRLLVQDNRLVGWIATFDREGERWFSIIVDSSQQGIGIGKKLIEMAQAEEEHLCGWVVDHEDYTRSDGLPYISPIPFYKKLGFKVLDEERYKGDRLSAVKIYWSKN